LAEFEKQFSRHSTPANRAYLAWGMKGHTSQSQQTLGALKAFGFIDYEGSGDTRAVSISDEGRTYLRAQQDEIKKQVLKRAALRPKWIAHFWPTWGADRPPDPLCLDTLVLTHKFNANTAPAFLKVYDESIAFAGLSSSDKVQSSVVEDDDEEETDIETLGQNPPEPPGRRGPAQVGMKEDTFNLDEGEVVLQWPERLSQASFDDLESWLQLQLRKIKRRVTDEGAAN
jgi:hypothetical protein